MKDPTSIGFIILMVLLAGALCYAGDLLGRKLGKKRLTILGLRPKHTAAMMTAFFGALSTLVIILILFAVSADVRTWIMEGNRAKTELIQTQKKLGDLEKDQSNLENENKTLTSDNDKVKSDLNKQKQELAKSLARVAKLTADTTRLGQKAATFQRQVNAAQRENIAIRAQIAKSKEEFKAVQLNNATIVKQNKEINDRNVQLGNENAALEKTLKDLNTQAEKLRKERDDLRTDLEGAQETFNNEIAAKTGELNRITSELTTASEELDDIQRQLEAQKRQLQMVFAQLNESQKDLRLRPLRVNRRDELARVPLAPRLNLAESRRALVLAVSLSSDEAHRRGAALVPGTDDYATFIDLPTSPVITGEEQIAKAINEMIDHPRPMLLIVRSLFNTFEGEYVPVEVQVVENPVIYAKDALVDEFDVDGSKTEQEIADVIAQRAATVIRDKAINAGMIVSQGRPQAIGQLSRETVLNLVQSIKTAGRRVQVRLYAEYETRAGDVLQLYYKIR